MIVTRLRAGTAGLLLMTALAACGGNATPSGVATLKSPGAGNDGNAAASAAPSASLDPEAAQLAFAKCMRDNGVDMPDPVAGAGGGGAAIAVGGDGIDPTKMQKAFESCQSFLGAGQINGGAQIDPVMQDKMVAFAKCMRENGVDMPDPVISSGGAGTVTVIGGSSTSSSVGAINPADPKFQKASEACQSILGDSLPGLSGGISTGGGAGPGIVVAPGGAQPAPVAP